MTRCRVLLLTVPLSLVIAGCGGAAPPAAPVTVTVTVPVPAATAAPSVAAPAPGTDDAQAASWVMPDLVGFGLQDAQNRIQSLTDNAIFVTESHDASGQGRAQVSDRNWKVCDQNIAPGERITADTRIDFGAVKLEERC